MSFSSNLFTMPQVSSVFFIIDKNKVALTTKLPEHISDHDLIVNFHSFRTFSMFPHFGSINNEDILDISFGHRFISINDDKKNGITVYIDESLKISPGFGESYVKLLKILDRITFPKVAQNIIEKIFKDGVFVIDGIKVYSNKIKLGLGYVGIENVTCNLNLNKEKLIISSKKNILQRKSLYTFSSNVLILPHLFDELRSRSNL